MNTIHVIGRLGADSEIKSFKNGEQFLSFSVATTEYGGGEKHTEWFNVACPTQRVIKMQDYLKKGSQVSVFGNEKVAIYQKNGAPAIGRSIMADRVDFVSSPQSEQQATSAPPAARAVASKAFEYAPSASASAGVQDEELPF